MAKTKWKGFDEMAREIRKIAKDFPDRVFKALYIVGEAVMGDSKENYVPVDLSPLKTSGHVREPKRGKGREISVELAYGGPSAPYALVQHENLDFAHRVGEAKYLEKPLMLAVRTMARDLGKLLDLDRL